MADASLASLSDTLFWAALAVYSASMLLFFAALAYRGRRTGSVATLVAWGGLIVHITSITLRGLAAGRVPWGNMFEYSNVLGALIVAVYLLVIDRRMGMRQVGGFALGGGVLALATARALYVEAGPLQPALDSMWLKIHVFAAIVGSALFGLSFVFSVLALLKLRAEARAPFGGSTVGAAYVGPTLEERVVEDLDDEETLARDGSGGGGFWARMPSSSRLDTLAYRTVQFAFPVWTFAVIAGAIWAHEAWGRYWGWDPKETWAFITWVVYAGYLHARATTGWRGQRAAILNMVGFGVVLFTYYGVNLLISGLHSYAK